MAHLRPRDSENQDLPGFVVLCPGKPVVGPQLWSNSFLPGIYQGTHINNKAVDPKSIIAHVANNSLGKDAQRGQLDLLQRMNEQHLESRYGDPQLEGRIQSLEMAFRMQFEAREAFDLGRETPATRALYGEGKFADACLIARRLAERGVRITQVYYGDGQPWDDHGDMDNHRDHAQQERRPDRRAAGRPQGPRPLRRDPGRLGRRVRPDPDLAGLQGARPPQHRLHHVAGRRRRQAGPHPRRRPTSSAGTPSRTASTSTTSTPPSST